MAATEKSLDEYLEELSIDTRNTWDPAEPLTYTVSGGGTSDPSYGAVPNIVIGGGIAGSGTISGTSNGFWTTGTSATPNVWQTTNPYTVMGTGSGNVQPSGTMSCKKVSLAGNDADLDINGKSLKAWMEQVEERLNILTPNPEMEKDWDDLRRLGERYRKLEKKCKEKSDMWNKLKAMPKPEIK